MFRTLLHVTGLLLVTATTLVGLLAFSAWREGARGGTERGAGAAWGGTVAEVLSTDRLRLRSGETVQLAAIIAPQGDEPFAAEGVLAVQALTAGQSVRLVGSAEAAFLYLPTEQLLQELLVSGGYARVAESASEDDPLIAVLRQSETTARDAGLGLWRGVESPRTFPTVVPTSAPIACEPSLVPGDTIGPEAAADNLGQFFSVVFFPIRLEEQNGTVTILAGLEEEAFGVIIPAGLASTVAEPGLAYLNRCVVATGRIERVPVGRGPRITLRGFDQVVILR